MILTSSAGADQLICAPSTLLHVTRDYPPASNGGISTAVAGAARAATAVGHRVWVLSFDAWRASRLVVDTGLHFFGWSRQQAIDYITENSPQAPNNISNEVDRYIGYTGQALAYKIGQREIFRLRDRAQETMGDRFDIKGFHDAVLASGAVPLDLLADLVTEWAEAASA